MRTQSNSFGSYCRHAKKKAIQMNHNSSMQAQLTATRTCARRTLFQGGLQRLMLLAAATPRTLFAVWGRKTYNRGATQVERSVGGGSDGCGRSLGFGGR